ncbi:MAG: protein-export chaperone SecB [Gammaproteobacteria bacterium]|nr:protein-export chaperone SecB [Gammaproteobacteria bacterium]
MSEAKNEATNEDQPQMDFGIQRIYVKDLSYEAPNSPQIFKEDWNPKVEIDLQSKSNRLEEGIYEVVLSVTSTVKVNDKMAFLVEVQQAGIFTIRHFPDEQVQHLLGSFCPSIIFPYARESITDLVTRGGFPQLYLAPINFDAIYQQRLAREQQEAAESNG